MPELNLLIFWLETHPSEGSIEGQGQFFNFVLCAEILRIKAEKLTRNGGSEIAIKSPQYPLMDPSEGCLAKKQGRIHGISRS